MSFPIKRYLATHGDVYYASAGMCDAHAFFDTVSEASEWCKARLAEQRGSMAGWAQVWDLEKDVLVDDFGTSSY